MNKTKAEHAVDHQLENVYRELSKVVIGRQTEFKLFFTALLANGHVLLEDLPGMGKTTMVRAFSKVLNCSFARVQCTPDLLPADVIGMSIFNPKTAEFSFREGPVFTNVLLVDEINRALPRTQSSLLESMEERQVSIEGQTYTLEQPFMVLATQNPIEMEGTFPLPEAQLDRFLIKLQLGYPDFEEEAAMLEKVGDHLPYDELVPVFEPAHIRQLQQACERVDVHPDVRAYIVALAQETRKHASVSVGASPRASKALFKAVKAWAFLNGRNYVLPDDVQHLLPYVWSHRLVLNSEADMTGITGEHVLQEVIQHVPIPEENVRYHHGQA